MNAAEIKKNLLRRFVSLITVGRRNKDKDGLEWNECWGSPFANKEDSEYSAWVVQAESLLHEVLPPKSPVRNEIKQIQKMSQRHVAFERILGVLEGVKTDVETDLFGLLQHNIRESVSVDYLEQAEALISDKTNKNCSHLPAAVLAGAVLENHLRVLCESANPPIKIAKDNGSPKKMTEMIDCLRRADIINEVQAKHLRAWYDIRNAAAHYRPNDITKEQVCAMIKGVGEFLHGK